ncbi:putative thioesterase [Actinacidiphila reveromycinica]|uniref:Putative thioesterase n=1 Tax=Actinacidiphila reveromycinica TaxID=659352 RepID=A0A7U3UPJ1_9ACTN|nr:alpha/beta fold hydrolase [Streptomyces sp. SN-593]BBA96392.1 putative thioesterase [Streptomyces sp. SN-593]
MDAATGAPPAGTVRPVVLEGAGVALSALLGEPAGGAAPRALVVAVHGGGMTAGYFDARARPGLSLLRLGARLGYAVLAVDRPGYGRSAAALPEGLGVAEQTAVLRAAVAGYADRHPVGAGVFLVGHSFGGKPALDWAARAEAGDRLLGVDVSGCGRRYAAPDGHAPPLTGPGDRRRRWGPLRLYPPGTFQECAGVVAPMPAREAAELAGWTASFARLAPRVRVPVRFTFAEHELLWRHTDADLAELAAGFTASPRVVLDRQPGAGHNLSLGWAARAYHLRALAFLEECLVPAATAPGSPVR